MYEDGDHVNLSFNNNLSTAVVVLDIENSFHRTWHFGLLRARKLSTLEFSTNLFKLNASLLTDKTFKVLVEG
jgi:hypothetical protein